MEFSDPFGTLVPRKLSNTELARSIMLDISSELDAVSLYQSHIDATDDPRAKAVLAHIRDEEKEHMAEFVSLLKLLDPDQARFLEESEDDIREILEEAGLSS